MFTRIRACRYRSLRYIDQHIAPFCALVGPNASGKSTFLDVLSFLSDVMRYRGDVLQATQQRSANFSDLLWMKEGASFELAVEAAIPADIQAKLVEKAGYTHVCYEVSIGIDSHTKEVGFDHEAVTLFNEDTEERSDPSLFLSHTDYLHNLPNSFIPIRSGTKVATIAKKTIKGNDNYYPEGKKSYKPSYKLGRTKSALANVPTDKDSFPVSVWLRDTLEQGVQKIVLNSELLRKPSPPGMRRGFHVDGGNLPWVIKELKEKRQERFTEWIAHVATALPDIQDIEVIERPEDKHCYLVVCYDNGARIPSWLVSDGTLRLLALTIIAYVDSAGIFLIEEPENGIHPQAMEPVLQSLRSIYDNQVLLATHSPVALDMLAPKDLLCFAKNSSGATEVVAGDLHPKLHKWKEGNVDLGTIFAAGILS